MLISYSDLGNLITQMKQKDQVFCHVTCLCHQINFDTFSHTVLRFHLLQP
jgi:hypothetical protein